MLPTLIESPRETPSSIRLWSTAAAPFSPGSGRRPSDTVVGTPAPLRVDSEDRDVVLSVGGLTGGQQHAHTCGLRDARGIAHLVHLRGDMLERINEPLASGLNAPWHSWIERTAPVAPKNRPSRQRTEREDQEDDQDSAAMIEAKRPRPRRISAKASIIGTCRCEGVDLWRSAEYSAIPATREKTRTANTVLITSPGTRDRDAGVETADCQKSQHHGDGRCHQDDRRDLHRDRARVFRCLRRSREAG